MHHFELVRLTQEGGAWEIALGNTAADDAAIRVEIAPLALVDEAGDPVADPAKRVQEFAIAFQALCRVSFSAQEILRLNSPAEFANPIEASQGWKARAEKVLGSSETTTAE